jgi:hypothetical protein
MRNTNEVVVIRNGVETVYNTIEAAAQSVDITVDQLQNLMFDSWVNYEQNTQLLAFYRYTEAQKQFVQNVLDRIYTVA